MAKSPVQTQQLSNALVATTTSFVDLPKVAAPFTTILNRATMSDLSRDLRPRMGIERVMVQGLVELDGEYITGAEAKRVFKPANDVHNAVRYVGNFQSTFTNFGPLVNGQTLNDYIEISFYGTGLNILTVSSSTASTDYRVSIDGAAESGTNFCPVGSTILHQRNYGMNLVFNVASGLSLGLHTVKIRLHAVANFMNLYGYEVINDATTIKTNSGSTYYGGQKRSLTLQNSQAYNSVFETGTLGTKGGRVLMYQKADGTIAKAVQPVDASALTLASTNHANEEMIATHHFREFGNGRTDDFSTLGAVPSNRAFVLEDGTTTLIGQNVSVGNVTTDGLAYTSSAGNYIAVVFVGTGLDVMCSTDSTRSFDGGVNIDGTSAGTLTVTTTTKQWYKIASGLPYGTHYVRFSTSAGAPGPSLHEFKIFGPKQPTIPSDAVKLADYNVMADFAVGSITGRPSTSTGVLRKDFTREMFFVNGTGGSDWGISAPDPANNTGVGEFFSSHQNSYVEYTFYGTGFVLRGRANTNRSSNIAVTVDGLALTTANFPSLVTSVAGWPSFTAGVLNMNAADFPGAAFEARGLPLGRHTVRFNQAAAGGGSNNIQAGALDIITPVHSARYNTGVTYFSDLMVGNESIGDARIIPALDVSTLPNWGQSQAVATSPSTTSTVLIPVPDLIVLVKSNGNPLDCSWAVNLAHDTALGDQNLSLFVDGTQVAGSSLNGDGSPTAGNSTIHSGSWIVPVEAGVHVVQMYWRTNLGTLTAGGVQRVLSVREL